MGRFSHEALMVDPRTGYVYETEDVGQLPASTGSCPIAPASSIRAAGSTCWRSASASRTSISARSGRSARAWTCAGCGSTIRWRRRRSRATRRARPRAARASAGSKARGGAIGTGYFLSTNGGSVGEGQVFEYDPDDETVKVIYDAPNANGRRQPGQHDRHAARRPAALRRCRRQQLHRRRAAGRSDPARQGVHLRDEQHESGDAATTTAVPAGDYRQSEWAGACYSPDGSWLFVNIQTPGVTFAITGPWGHGPL